MEIIWKDIKGYEGLYEASNTGAIRSKYKYNSRKKHKAIIDETNYKYLKPIEISKTNKYLKVTLIKNKKKKQVRIHRIIAETFIDNPENKQQINHIDGNKQNNIISNLEWSTSKENINHAYSNNLMKSKNIKMIDIKTGETKIFYRRNEIEKYLGRKICQDLITRCCNGNRKTAYKMKWEYI